MAAQVKCVVLFYNIWLCSSVTLQEFQALQDFYQSTNGDGWKCQTNWNQLVDINNYNTTIANNICLPQNTPYGVTCDNFQQHISSLYFFNNSLNGTLPSTIGNLLELEEIALIYEPDLYGSIPSSVYNLSNLTVFELYVVGLNGTISDAVGNFFEKSRLEELIFVDTMLSGTIASKLWRIASLQYLQLQYNTNN